MFLSRKFANTHSMKALRGYFALAESQPTSATLSGRARSVLMGLELFGTINQTYKLDWDGWMGWAVISGHADA